MRCALVVLCWLAGSASAEGLPDVGIFPELTAGVEFAASHGDRARVDVGRGTIVVYQRDVPVAAFAYPKDEALVAKLLPAKAPIVIVKGDPKRRPEPGDRDGDGIPDTLDVLVGARKLLANGAEYHDNYRTLAYPGGDVPRTEGVCTDTVIRSLRNAGLDLQKAVQEDIKAAPRAYPMVKKRNKNIDHRRVKTILPWFRRNLKLVSASEPFRAGDIVFMDTFASRAGPDHIGVISDRIGDDGRPLVINNWTNGATDAEMDLLSFVPVLYRFRLEAK